MKTFFAILTVVSQFLGVATGPSPMIPPDEIVKAPIRYVALGDSYTIGEGVQESERWPNVLVDHLQGEGITIELVANPSQTGWTTQQLLDGEIPVFLEADADVVSVMIGVNDYFQGVSREVFEERFSQVLDAVQAGLEDPSQILIVTIPDYSVTPTGAQFDDGNVSAGIAAFNQIIQAEASSRGLPVVDVFALSQESLQKPTWVADDGLHPSAEQYRAWEALIFPDMLKLLER